MLVMNKLFVRVRNRVFENNFSRRSKHIIQRLLRRSGELKTWSTAICSSQPFTKTWASCRFKRSQVFISTRLRMKSQVFRMTCRKANQENGAKNTFFRFRHGKDFRNAELKAGFAKFDLEFLAYLITGDGAPPNSKYLEAVRGMVDGVIDADRLDYVYRDAAATIGSLSRPSTVLESIIGYEPGHVIVCDPRPVTDFLSTRMRLFTFVYSSADVRFRQVLLRTFLDGNWDCAKSKQAFRKAKLNPNLSHEEFLALDDHSLIERIKNTKTEHLAGFRKHAQRLLLRETLDYECRVVKRAKPSDESAPKGRLPEELFFDLLGDRGRHQLYQPKSVLVRQGLTSRIAKEVPIETSAGAFSPIFSEDNSATLVSDAFYLFLPKVKIGGSWPATETAMRNGQIFHLTAWEDARRNFLFPTDTRVSSRGKTRRAISISYCWSDFPTVIRVVRELNAQRRHYLIFLRPFDGTGGTAEANSRRLITEADSVLALVSETYLKRRLMKQPA